MRHATSALRWSLLCTQDSYILYLCSIFHTGTGTLPSQDTRPTRFLEYIQKSLQSCTWFFVSSLSPAITMFTLCSCLQLEQAAAKLEMNFSYCCLAQLAYQKFVLLSLSLSLKRSVTVLLTSESINPSRAVMSFLPRDSLGRRLSDHQLMLVMDSVTVSVT